MRKSWPTKRLEEESMKDVYLIGVNHQVQYNENLLTTQHFKDCLKQMIKDWDIKLVAEEFSEQALKLNRTKRTIAQNVAKDCSIRHKFCDPDEAKRKELGIPSRQIIKAKLGLKGLILDGSKQDQKINKEQRKYDSIREQFWAGQILNESYKNIIFVCGSVHLQSFKSLLLNYGCNVSILDRFDKEKPR